MAAKKKVTKKVNIQTLMDQDETLIALKERYFKLLKTEDIGKTPKLTKVLDNLETVIDNRIEELKNV
jgi:predicted RNA-binding protein with EMAP domain